MSSFPQSLSDLLSGLSTCLYDTLLRDAWLDVDRIIVLDHWTKDFQNYLRQRNLEEDDHILCFLTHVQIVLCYENLCLHNINNNNIKLYDKLKSNQSKMFHLIIKTFFAENSEKRIALSNQYLFQQLSSYSRQIDDAKKHIGVGNMNVEMLNHLQKAHKVCCEDFNSTFLKFLKRTNTIDKNPISY